MTRARTQLRLILPHREWVDTRSVAIRRTFRVGDFGDRVVLFAWSADPEPRKRNVARIDRHGNVAWRAELPGNGARDAFVSLVLDGDTFVARTYYDWEVRFNSDGEVERIKQIKQTD